MGEELRKNGGGIVPQTHPENAIVRWAEILEAGQQKSEETMQMQLPLIHQPYQPYMAFMRVKRRALAKANEARTWMQLELKLILRELVKTGKWHAIYKSNVYTVTYNSFFPGAGQIDTVDSQKPGERHIKNKYLLAVANVAKKAAQFIRAALGLK